MASYLFIQPDKGKVTSTGGFFSTAQEEQLTMALKRADERLSKEVGTTLAKGQDPSINPKLR